MLKQLREHPLGHQPILDHVRDTRGHTQIILQHVERAVAIAHQIGPADMRPLPMLGAHALALRPVVDRLFQQFAGEHTVANNLLVGVDVLDEQVERLHTLLEARVGASPFPAVDNPGENIERPGAIQHAALGVHGKRDSHRFDGQIGGDSAVGQFLAAHSGQRINQRSRRNPGSAGRFEQLIKKTVGVVFRPVQRLS